MRTDEAIAVMDLDAEIERLRGIIKRADTYVADLLRHGTIDMTLALEIRRKLKLAD